MGRDKLRAWEARQRERRERTAAEAARLIGEGRHDEAEAVVRGAEEPLQAAVTLAGLYRERLEQMAREGSRHGATVEEVFRRAKEWAWSAYPEPHTQMEAEQYEAGRGEDLARLVGVLGWEPAT